MIFMSDKLKYITFIETNIVAYGYLFTSFDLYYPAPHVLNILNY